MFVEWVKANMGEAIALAVVALSTIIQVSPIKINPWSWLARTIGRAINKELKADLDDIRANLSEHTRMDDERYAKQCRLRILRFNDEILQDRRHTKEHYDEILDDVTEYERYCETHPGYRNSRAVMAISNVEAKYQEHQAAKDFL